MKLNAAAKIGLIVGLIGGLVGLTAGILADPVMGSIMAAIFIVVFAVIYFAFFRPFIVQGKLLKTGTPASAKVLEVSDTGVTINNNPQVKLLLEVSPPMGMPYKVETKVLVSRINPYVYQPGMVVPVKVDLNDKDKVAIDPTGVSAAETHYSAEHVKNLESMVMHFDNENKQIMAVGEPARAIVLKYTPLGINVNGNNPAVMLDLEVLPESKSSFKASAKGVIMEQSVPKFQPGEEIYVKFDPNDNKRVSIDHS